MPADTCDRCSSKTFVTIAAGDAQHALCKTHAAPITPFIDDLLGDGMELFSPQSTNHCANCLAFFNEEQPIIIRIGASQRHALCTNCAAPIIDILAINKQNSDIVFNVLRE
jgi:hypothetical protein